MAETIKLITVCSHPEHATGLIISAKKHGWDLVVVKHDWMGFGTKVIGVRQYLTDNPQVDRFIFADAFDVVVLGGEQEFLEKMYPENFYMLASTERNLWPANLEPYRDQYPKAKHGFNYLNSGLYYVNDVKQFMEATKDIKFSDDDQYYLNMQYNQGKGIGLDYQCRVFQSYSFIQDDDYTYNNHRLQNLKTGTEPIFVHGNGRTDMTKIYEIA